MHGCVPFFVFFVYQKIGEFLGHQGAGEREEEGYMNEGRTEKMWLFVSMQTDYN